jgi:hypothetical protein
MLGEGLQHPQHALAHPRMLRLLLLLLLALMLAR